MPTPFQIYFGGGEEPGWARMLVAADAAMQISFKNLQRRIPKTKPYSLADRFDPRARIFLDSGAYSFNDPKNAGKVDEEFLRDYARRYETFVLANIDRVEMVSEADLHALGADWIQARREDFYDDLDPAKFMPVWHPEDGLDTLRALGQKYDVVGVTDTKIGGLDLQQPLNLLARSGVRLHGIAMTKPDDLRMINFSSVASTSWLSPQKYGDTIVWDNGTLHRYPRDQKEVGRRRHAPMLKREGFDVDALLADDPKEVVRLSLWSWQQFAASLSERRGNHLHVVTPSGDQPDDAGAQVLPLIPTHVPEGAVTPNPIVGPKAIVERAERRVLPVLSFTTETSTFTNEAGEEVTEETLLVRNQAKSQRICDSCYVSDRCPMFTPGMECAFDIPVEVKTPTQALALRQGLIEMQAQRVAFMKMSEDLAGGMPDPNLSAEMDRLWKHMSQKHEIEDDRTSIDVSIKAKGQASTLERIFGRDPAPMPGMGEEQVNREMTRVLEGEVVRP